MAGSAERERRSRYHGFESVPLRVTVRVGRTRLSLARAGELAEGDVLALDRSVGSPFDLLAGEVPLGEVEPVAVGESVGFKLVSTAEPDDADR